jgi:alanyl-tRNA synthetase
MTVDEDGFKALMEEQKQRARAARGDMSNAWQGLDLGLDNTPTTFTGYTNTADEAVVLALVTEGEVCGVMKSGDEGIVVLDKTPFYAEMGGQSADHGTITVGEAVFTVTDVQKNKGGKYLHHGKLESGELRVGETVSCELDLDRRHAIMRAHSATHLLQKALRTVLGDHVQQAGSLVEPDKLRFDFTHFGPMTYEEKMAVENIVNEAILSGYAIVTEEMSIEQAKTKGAMMLFGEKYGESVRVVDMGGYSVELCGGTHLDNTAKAGPFHISAEFSVASGVRRIEATTGMESLQHTVDLVGVDRVLFGSDMPITYAGAYGQVLELKISDEDKEKIFWKNTAQLFGEGF